MRKFWCILFLIASISTSCLAQSYRENRRMAEKITTDTLYYYGDSGECASAESAYGNGIENLLKNISSNYKSNMLCDIGFEPYRKFVEQNVSSLIISDEKVFRLFFYMKRSELRDEINFRYENILSYINHANDAIDDSRVGDALRFYYWAQMLCYAHPNGARLVYDDGESKQLIKKWLNDRIEEITASIRMFPVEMDTVDGDLHVTLTASTTDGKTISNLRYFYNNGQNYRINTFKDSRSLAILKHLDAGFVNAKIDVQYYSEAEYTDSEVFMMMNYLKQPLLFSGAVKKISLKSFREKAKEKEIENVMKTDIVSVNIGDNYEYVEAIKDVEKAIRIGNINGVRCRFSENGYAMFNALTKYGRYSVVGTPKYNIVDNGKDIISCSVPIRFDFSGNVNFYNDVVFRFDKTSHKITSLAFKLTDAVEKYLLSKSELDNDSKMVLINFLEDYQTAYALKRLDYLEQIFSDDAVIIVGKESKSNRLMRIIRWIYSGETKSTELDKNQYLDGLESAFNSREYINIRFTGVEIINVGNAQNVYGIQLKQEFTSSSYSDVGYLFLLLDIHELTPLVHVRTWQKDAFDIESLVRNYCHKM